MKEITQVIRKFDNANSIDTILSRINPLLNKNFKIIELRCPYSSDSIKNIFLNCLWACKIKSNVVHLTGDINYLSFFIKSNFIITTILDLGETRKLNYFKNKLYNFFWIFLPIYKSNKIITISHHINKELIKRYPSFERKLITIYIPTDINYIYSEKIMYNKTTRILHIATSYHNKNTFRVAQAIQNLDVEYIIVGKVPLDTLNFIIDNKIKWKLLSNLSTVDLYNEYCKSDLVIFPSIYEGFGMPIIEGQSIGRVILTSNIDPMKEIAGDGAILVNPFDFEDIKKGILYFINNTTERKNIINKGLQNLKRFDINNIINDYIKVYDV
jgi:hypothetical protein